MFDPREKIAVLIDGANLYSASRALGFDIDYRRLLSDFRQKGYLVRAIYYTALAEDQEYSSLRPLIDWLDYNGYRVVTKPLREFTDAQGRRKVKGNMDIELAVDAMEMADHIDHFVLFSGDGDFRHLVEALQRKGKKVTVASTLETAAADDRRRSPPPGRPFSRAFDARRDARPRSGAAAAAAAARDRTRKTRTSSRSCERRRTPAARAAARLPALPAARRVSRTLAGARAGLAQRARRRRSARRTAALLIVGLAPGLRGANRTGRPFTGDYAGELLYATLLKYGFATRRLSRRPRRRPDAGRCGDRQRASAACRRRTSRRRRRSRTCRQFLDRRRSPRGPTLQAIVALGRIAHETTLRALGAAPRRLPLRARRGARARRAAPLRQLSLLPLQHEHRRADDGDVRGGVCASSRRSRRQTEALRQSLRA